MDVGLGLVGDLEVHHVGDAVHIQATSGNVAGDQHGDLALAETLKGADAVVLALVAVDRSGLDPGDFQAAHDLISAVLGPSKDDGAANFGALEDAHQERQLLALGDHEYRLVDGFCSRRHGCDGDLDRIFEQEVREVADLTRHGRRKQQGLLA